MGFIDNLRSRAAAWGVSKASDDYIQIEAYKRDKGKKDPITDLLKREANSIAKKNLRDWKLAVASATDPENPEFLLLDKLYKNLMLDGHLMSAIDSRILRIQHSSFLFKDKSGKVVEEAAKLLKASWFEDFIRMAIMYRFTGVTVLELWELDEDGALSEINEIPKANLNAKKKRILKEEGGTEGYDYGEGAYEPYFLQIGKELDLGMVADMAPMLLAKKLAIGSWLDFIEKFGVPPRWVTTDRQDTQRRNELFEMMMAMISNQVAILTGNEKIEIAQTPNTDAHEVFNQMIERMNSEISKRILGATGTTDEKSHVGAAQVHERVANDRHESDRLFIKNLVNRHLLPKLVKISPYYAPLANYTFEWDYTEEMSAAEIIDSVSKLGNQFEFDIEKLAQLTGLPIVGAKTLTQQPGGAGEGK